MQTNFFKISKTARYYTLGEANPKTKHIWFVLHGYGQLGRFFIRQFSSLKADDRLIVAPEAPNRFYLSGTDGRVGANWMTKEERLTDIDDYCEYLNSLLDHIQKSVNPNCKVHIFGFSQGVATSLRWVNNFTCSNLVSLHSWGGTFPPDIDYKLNQKKFSQLNLTAHFGDNDKYIPKEKANNLIKQLESQEIVVEKIDYIGEHKIYPELLSELFEKGELRMRNEKG